MNFTTAISTCLSKYATFQGRASRSEFWWFYLFTLLISWGSIIVGAATLGEYGADILSMIVSLVFVVPTIAAGSRRLHDIGRSGWWQLISFTIIGIIVLLIWLAKDTVNSENEYGEPVTA